MKKTNFTNMENLFSQGEKNINDITIYVDGLTIPKKLDIGDLGHQ